jgi:protein-tyrosine phosphatase
MLEDGEQQSLISIARKPLDHIPASDCPCCSDWVDRLKERTMVVNSPSNPPDQIVSVVPAVFKRHLASHMEQLALFAIPLSVDNEKADSNAAIEDDVDALPGNLDQSTLTFPSSRPSSPASSEGLSDITRNRQDSSKTRDKEERGLRPGKYVESDDDHSEGSETAVNRKPGTLSSPRQANISAKRSHLSDLGIDRPSSADNMTGQQPDWATFHNVQMKDLEDVDSKEIERQGILHVIVQSEEAYVTRLDLLYTGFRDRLISAQPPVIDPNRLDGFIRVVLGKVDAVKRANEDHLLPQMRYRQQEQSPWIIGYSDIFREWVKIAEQAYFAYATALPDANFLIRQEADKNVAFQGFLDATRSLSKQNWNKLLNAPLTQIREYTLFLERVFHLSAPDSEECLNLRCAINEIKDIASRCELVATAKTRPEWYYSSDGTVDAPYPEPVTHTPPPPLWLSKELAELKKKYPNGLFEATMRYVITDQATMASIKVDRNSPLPQNAKSQYAPRIRCLDCPGKLYTAGPGQTLENFEVHLSNRLHTANVEMRLVSEELVKVLELSPEDESKLKLSSGEKLYFSHLFALADTEKLGVVTGERALRFFESTEVANEVLGEMWQIVDSENRGLLTPFGFCQFLRLVGHYQDGRNPTLEATSIPGPAPKFKGITNPFVSDVKDPAFTDSLSDVEIDSVQPTRGDAVDSTHKSANEDRTGPQVLFESMKDVLMELKACEQAHPFLQHVNETEAPEYYTVIKHPMAISTVMEKLQERRYRSKHEFGDDLMLIWANCLKYNADPAHPLREKALYMKNETEKLVPLIPNIFIRDYAEAKTGAKGEPQDATVLGTEKRSSSPTPLGYERLADDPFPYPAFLRYTKEEAQLKFVDLEWEQRKRLASGVKEADASPWVRVDQSLTKNRNRYANVDPYANNRVKLKVPEPYNDYINASPIELVSSKSKTVTKFIATQGPKQDTISHFWRMVWDETNSYAEIIMLTQTHESGREKCYSYFPRSHEDEQLRINEHDEFEDGMVYDIVLEDLREYHAVSSHVRDIAMIHFNTSERKRIRHYLFNGWPDFAVPEGNDRRALIELIKMSRKEMGDNFANPRVVHDSAGVGRTGTFIALDWLLQELEEGSLDHLDDDQDPIAEVVDRLRQQRMMMVQGESQFVFLYDVIRGQWRERWIKLHPDEAERLIKPHHEKLTVRGGINLGSELQEVSLEEEFREGESPSRYHRGRGIAVSAKRARKEGNVY